VEVIAKLLQLIYYDTIYVLVYIPKIILVSQLREDQDAKSFFFLKKKRRKAKKRKENEKIPLSFLAKLILVFDKEEVL